MKAYQLGGDDSERAFETLYERYAAKVYGFLRRRLSEESIVEEVFQATFLKLHQARRRYDPSFPFAPWLFTVCRSVLTDAVRKSARSPETVEGDVYEIGAATPSSVSSEGSTPDLEKLISPLTVQQKEALELRYAKDLSFDEIARRLETSPANVRQMVSRAVRKIRAASAKEGS